MRIILTVLLIMLLAGCGTQYVHPSKDDHELKLDRSECRSLCLSEYPVEIEVQYTRLNLENSSEFVDVDINKGARTRCINKCLAEKGWKIQ